MALKIIITFIILCLLVIAFLAGGMYAVATDALDDYKKRIYNEGYVDGSKKNE